MSFLWIAVYNNDLAFYKGKIILPIYKRNQIWKSSAHQNNRVIM